MSFAQSLQFIIISQEHLEREGEGGREGGRGGGGGGGGGGGRGREGREGGRGGRYKERERSKNEQAKGRSGKIAL